MNDNKLFQPGAPCFYLGIMGTSDLDDLRMRLVTQHPRAASRLVRGKKSTTVDSFFNEIAAALQFPLYFGENWSAFHECILDLDWIEEEAYVVLVSDALFLLRDDAEDFRILVDILSTANKEWLEPNKYIPRTRPITPFHVVLQCTASDITLVSERLTGAGAEFEVL